MRPSVTGLSGNEIYCMKLKGFSPSAVLVGNSVRSMGVLRGIRSAFRGALGGEVADMTALIHEGRDAAFKRMVDEAAKEGVTGIVGVSSELRSLSGNAEFLFVGSGVRGDGAHFSSAGDAQELFCHMDAGYVPRSFVFGNVAYAMGVGQGLSGMLKTLVRGEVDEYSQVFNGTRHLALSRLAEQAAAVGANAVVGVRTHVMWFQGVHEMYMVGTAAYHPSLPSQYSRNPVTSDLTGEELWAMASLGYAPIKLLLSTSVYSLGVVGGLKAAFKGVVKGEIGDLTTLVYDAREKVFDRLRQEAADLGADEVVGIKTYIEEIGGGFVEIMAVGTAVRKLDGMGVQSAQLPPQAIIRDRDTWLSGDASFDTTEIRAGG